MELNVYLREHFHHTNSNTAYLELCRFSASDPVDDEDESIFTTFVFGLLLFLWLENNFNYLWLSINTIDSHENPFTLYT